MPLAEPLQQVDRTFVRHRGRKLSYYGGCDYFRLASHPEVLRALHDGADQFGLNVAASRLTTGNHHLFDRLEKDLSRFFAVERAALISSGYAANLAFAQTFAKDFTHALIDERAHGSLWDATAMLDCEVVHFSHRDPKDFAAAVKRCGRKARFLAMTDGMFAHDGTLAPLSEYLGMLPRDAVLLVDDTHGAGTLGRRGRGTAEALGVNDERVVRTITLSKAFGVYGGAVLAAREMVEAIQSRSRLFIGNTPPPLPLVNAALTALTMLRRDTSLRKRLNENTTRIKSALRAAGLELPNNAAPIVAFTPQDARHAATVSGALLRAGIFPSLIRYASSTAYFRFAISSEHTLSQIDALVEVLSKHA